MDQNLISLIGETLPKDQPQGSEDSLFDSLIWQESRGHQTNADGTPVTSKKGAVGIAQVMPGTAPEAAQLAGLPYDEIRYRTDADYNRRLGRAYFDKQMVDFGDEAQALAAYNAGPGAVRRALAVAQKNGQPGAWLQYLPAETQSYVPAIMARRGKTSDTPTAQAPTWADPYGQTQIRETPERSGMEAVADLALGLGSGLATGVQLVAAAAGADNPVAQAAGDASRKLTSLQSPARQFQREQRAAVIQTAERSGDTLQELAAYGGAFLDAPTETILNAVGTSAPTLLLSFIPGLNQVAAARFIAAGAVGATQGAGVVKGAIYDAVYQQLKATGVSDEDAQKAAAGAQAYGSENADQILIGAGLGALAGTTGAEAAIGRIIGKRAADAGASGLFKSIALGVAKESPVEAAQGGQERLASNMALQNEGFDVPTMQGVAGQALLEGVASGPIGGVAGMIERPAPVPAGLEPVAAKAAEPNSPLSRAAMAGNTGPLADAARAQQAAQDQAIQKDPAERLAELEAISRGAPERKNADGQTIPGTPARLFTEAEQAEYQQLKSRREATDSAAGRDPRGERAAQIAAALRETGLDAFRAEGSVFDPKKIVADLALAQSPSARADQREQAIGRLEIALQQTGVSLPAAAGPDAAAQESAAAPEPAPAVDRVAALREQVDRATGASHIPSEPQPQPEAAAFDLDDGRQIRTEQAFLRDQANAQVAAQDAPPPPVDRVLEALRVAPPLRSAEQTAIARQAATRYSAEDMQLLEMAANFGAGLSATQRIRLQQLRGTTNPAAAVGQEMAANVAEESGEQLTPPEAREQVLAPRVSTPAGAGPSVQRRRRAELRKVIEMGLTMVQRKDTGAFVLTDGRREFALNNPADVQMARRERQAWIDAKANAAATSPANDRPEPTPAQIDANEGNGNWKKGDPIRLYPGVTFITENPKGSTRKSKPGAKKKWSTLMRFHYGDIAGTRGADGDKIDAFYVGSGSRIFVIDQVNPETGKFDEHKVMLDVLDEKSARAAYLANYEKGWKGLGAITEMSLEQFRAWIKRPATKPVGDIRGAARPDPQRAAAAGNGSAGAQPGAGLDDRGAGDGRTDAWARDRVARLFGATHAADGTVAVRGGRAYVTVQVDGKPNEIELVDRPDMGISPERGEARRPVDGSAAAVITAIAEALGKKVVFFRGDIGGDGFVDPRFDDVIFLSERSGINPVAVLGHEFWHLVRREMPEVHEALRTIVAARVKKGGNKAFREDYHGKATPADDSALGDERGGELEELVSDLGGNLMADPKFWREVMDEVQRAHPQQAKTLVARFAAFFGDLLDKVLAAIRAPKFRADAFVKDLQTIRGAFRQALAQYIAANGMRQTAMQAQVLREQQGIARSKSRDVTQTAAFKQWFGDSKVVDADGRPLRVFHGTNRDFSTFENKGRASARTEGGRFLDGRSMFFFTSDADVASGFAGQSEGANVQPSYLALQNPLVIDGRGKNWARYEYQVKKAFDDGKHDGAILHNVDDNVAIGGKPSDVYVSFRPEQIKSATGNDGSFDPNNSDITSSAQRAPRTSEIRDNQPDEQRAGAQPAEAGSGDGAAPSYGRAQPGSSTAVGIHFSKQPRTRLDASAYGTGAKGLERERLEGRENADIRPRIFFYVDKGRGVNPEDGVGSHAHRVQLRNLYDVWDDPLKLVQRNPGANNWERAILQAGFDGYLNLDKAMPQGYAVLLGAKHKSVPVQSFTPPGFAPAAEQPTTMKKGLMSRELNAIDIERIPGARVTAGNLVVPVESRDAANAELERIGSDVRLSRVREGESPKTEYAIVEAKFRNTEEWLKAPNGQPTNLTERQWVHVRTPAFKRWFGDWERAAREHGPNGVWHLDADAVSKAVDENGEPLVVYHGTDDAGFARFWETGGKMRGDLGIFATDHIGMASSYVRRGRAMMIGPDDIDTEDSGNRKSGIYALFLNIRQATEDDFDGAQWSGDFFDEGGRLVPEKNIGRVTDDVVRESRNVFKADGAIIRNVVDDGGGAGYDLEPGDIFVVFDPKNVKSADFNAGSYNIESDDIRRSKTRKPGSDIGHKRFASNGSYVGAPDWIGSSPQQLAFLRKKLKDLAIEGESGRYWYESSSRAVLDLVGGDKAEAEKFVALLAIFSQGTSVDANTTFALTAYYQWKSGLPIDTGRFPSSQSKKAEAILRANRGWEGVKTNNFYADLMEEIDASKVDPDHATMDMWMALAFDYGAKVLDQGPKYHFAKREIIRLADELGWKPHQVQAAIWTSIKARVEGTERQRGEVERKKKIEAGSYEHFRLAHKLAVEADFTPEQIGATYFDFATAIEQHAVQMSWEATPSKSGGALPGIYAAPVAQKFEYLIAVQEALTEGGKDLVAEAVGAPQGMTVTGASAWEGEVGAGAQTLLAGALETRPSTEEERAEGFPKTKRALRKVAKDLLDVYAAARGFVLTQDAVIYHSPIWSDSISRHNGIQIRTSRAPTVQEVADLYNALIEKFETTELAPGYRPDGVRILNFTGMDNKAFHRGVREVMEAMPDGGVWDGYEAVTFRSEGDYIGNDWKENPNGEGYLAQIQAQRPDLLGRLADLRARVARVNEDFAARYGWGQGGQAGAAAQAAVAGSHDRRSAEANPPPERILRSTARGASRDEAGNLAGLPTLVEVPGRGPVRVGHWAPAERVAQRYMRAAGLPYNPPSQYVKVDPERAQRIAEAYEAMEHAPQDPRVRAAYQALARETTAQYKAVVASGLKVEFIDADQGDPYAASPRLMTEDVRRNNHMWVFPTRDGFGTREDFDPKDNPLLAETEFEISGQKALVNDLFRVVHDYFGHVKEGIGFRANGEENSWRAHSAMFSPLARAALTTETRGQNSWLNFGPHGEANRKASASETVFADQKTGLLPDWVVMDGAADTPAGSAAPAQQQTVALPTQQEVASGRQDLQERIQTVRKLIACLAGKR